MIYGTARRLSDGILYATDASLNSPDAVVVVANAVRALGGSAGDWEYLELTQAQYLAQLGALPARSKLVDSVVTSATAPSVNLSASEVEADGVATLTLTVDCHDITFNGTVTLRIVDPSGVATVVDLTATLGVVNEVISTAIEGVHQAEVQTVRHGVAFTSFEGI